MTGPQSTYLNAVRGAEWNKAIRKAARVAEQSSVFGSPQIADDILRLIKQSYAPKQAKNKSTVKKK